MEGKGISISLWRVATEISSSVTAFLSNNLGCKGDSNLKPTRFIFDSKWSLHLMRLGLSDARCSPSWARYVETDRCHSKFIRTTSNFDGNLHKVDQTLCDLMSPPIVANAFNYCRLYSCNASPGWHCGLVRCDIQRPGHWTINGRPPFRTLSILSSIDVYTALIINRLRFFGSSNVTNNSFQGCAAVCSPLDDYPLVHEFRYTEI